MENDLAERLGRNLRKHRGDKTLVEFASKLGISKSSLARLESGEQNFTKNVLDKLCAKLECDILDLFRKE